MANVRLDEERRDRSSKPVEGEVTIKEFKAKEYTQVVLAQSRTEKHHMFAHDSVCTGSAHTEK